MVKDNLFTGDQAREKLMNGVRRAAQAVAVTLGTSGSNSLVECIESPGHYSTNDGATILASIHFEDYLEEMGRKILLEAVSRANRASGDGSSTTSVLCAAILEEGMKHIGETSPMEIKRSLEACIPLIEKSINDQKKEITVDTVAQVASISAEDEQIGNTIQEIYQKIGKDGIINWEASKTPEDWYSIGTGLTVHGATYMSRYMCDLVNGQYEKRATIENPYVFLAKSKITAQFQMEKLIAELTAKDIKDLVIFCNEMEVPILNSFVLARAPQTLGIRFLVIKMPVIFRDEWWEDLEKASGGKIISPESGIGIANAKMDFLGKFERITVDGENTYIDGTQDLTTHILALKVDGSDDALNRAQRLNTRTARYFVGAHSESALAYRRLKVEDAINAASCALQNGVVVGGGKALVNASVGLDNVILKIALAKPFEQIVANTRGDIAKVWGELNSQTDGFNSKTGEVQDLLQMGVIDPADVVINAVKNAIGVAASILTIGTVVTLPREEAPTK